MLHLFLLFVSLTYSPTAASVIADGQPGQLDKFYAAALEQGDLSKHDQFEVIELQIAAERDLLETLLKSMPLEQRAEFKREFSGILDFVGELSALNGIGSGLSMRTISDEFQFFHKVRTNLANVSIGSTTPDVGFSTSSIEGKLNQYLKVLSNEVYIDTSEGMRSDFNKDIAHVKALYSKLSIRIEGKSEVSRACRQSLFVRCVRR